MTREIFEIYVETRLARTLAPGDVVILDNLPSHKSGKAAALLKARGASFLFLPPTVPISTQSRLPSGLLQTESASPA